VTLQHTWPLGKQNVLLVLRQPARVVRRLRCEGVGGRGRSVQFGRRVVAGMARGSSGDVYHRLLDVLRKGEACQGRVLTLFAHGRSPFNPRMGAARRLAAVEAALGFSWGAAGYGRPNAGRHVKCNPTKSTGGLLSCRRSVAGL